jgi:ATP-dependent Clp protease protease subunit
VNIEIPDIETYLISTDNESKDMFKLPDPHEVNYWKARAQRTFYVDYVIDSQIGTDRKLLLLSKTIIEMNVEEKDIPKENLKPITIYIDSLGGEVDATLNLIDVMMISRIPIITVGMRNVMSSGFLIFIAGTRRYIFEHTNMMTHSGSAWLSGTAEQLAAAQSNYN